MTKFVTRKYDGDDLYSWAVFRKADLPKGHRGVVFAGQARPAAAGLSKRDAEYYKTKMENLQVG